MNLVLKSILGSGWVSGTCWVPIGIAKWRRRLERLQECFNLVVDAQEEEVG